MTTAKKPARKPQDPRFSSGPSKKRPGYSVQSLASAALGRSHRSKLGKAKLKEAIDRTRSVLQVPDSHRIGIVPASDTGAIEMVMWSMLGARPLDNQNSVFRYYWPLASAHSFRANSAALQAPSAPANTDTTAVVSMA